MRSSPAVAISSLPATIVRDLRPWKRPEPKKQPGKRKRDQIAFYASAQWRALSKACLERDGRICQWCGAEATQAAHLDPSKLWDTTLADLAASCGEDNLGERERRIFRAVMGT